MQKFYEQRKGDLYLHNGVGMLGGGVSLAQPDPFHFSFSWGRGKAKGLVTALCMTSVTGMQFVYSNFVVTMQYNVKWWFCR